MGIIDTRVCIDDRLGPLDCQLDPEDRWKGWLVPSFSLDVTRELSAQTLRVAGEHGYDETIHVIDGRADSAETVHVIEAASDHVGGPLAVAVHVDWRALNRGDGDATTITRADAKAREAARRCKPGGRGAHRAVVAHIRWQELGEGVDAAVSIVQPQDGRYSVGAWEWAWHFDIWWCVCGSGQDWPKLRCEGCGRTRDGQPPVSGLMRVAAHQVSEILRRLAPEVTSVWVDLHTGQPRICATFAGDTAIDPFDVETLGEADAILGCAVDSASGPGELVAAGWVPDLTELSTPVYRITFPASS